MPRNELFQHGWCLFLFVLQLNWESLDIPPRDIMDGHVFQLKLSLRICHLVSTSSFEIWSTDGFVVMPCIKYLPISISLLSCTLLVLLFCVAEQQYAIQSPFTTVGLPPGKHNTFSSSCSKGQMAFTAWTKDSLWVLNFSQVPGSWITNQASWRPSLPYHSQDGYFFLPLLQTSWTG